MPTALSFCPPPLSVSLFLSLRPSSSPCLLCVCVCVCVWKFCVCVFLIIIYFCLYWVFVAVWAFLKLWGAGAILQLWGMGFSMQWRLLLGITGSRACPFQQLRHAGSRAQTRKSWRTGLVALQHVGSSCTRDDTRVSCISRWILHHLATWEALLFLSFICLFSVYGI